MKLNTKKNFKKINFIILFLITQSICNSQVYYEKVDGNTIATMQTYYSDSINPKVSAANDYIGFYQTYISGIRGQECPMYPSCSNFGLKTFNEKNFFTAFILTSDRLLRCGHDHKNYDLTLRTNGFKYLDFPAYEKPPTDLYYKRNVYYYAYSDGLNDSIDFNFIKKLMNNQYFQEALLEIMRLETQITSFNVELFINKIICLKALGNYEIALFDYENKCPEEHKTNIDLLYQIALIQYKLENFDQAINLNLISLKASSDTFLRPKILMLSGLLYAKNNDWTNSIESYRLLSEIKSYNHVSSANLRIAESAYELKNRSPVIAGVMSIVPGAGYAYTGHSQTAIAALLVNGLLAYATYTSFKNENYGLGILTGVFNLSFYIGNSLGSVKSANRFNVRQRKSIIDNLEFNSQL